MDEEAEASDDASEDDRDGDGDADGDGFERDFIDDASPAAGPSERCAALCCTPGMGASVAALACKGLCVNATLRPSPEQV